MKQLKQETGRSMVEMLGVLAVIGVLSVGGISGYTLAMNKHRANSVAADLMKRAVVISAQRQLGQTANVQGLGSQVGEYTLGSIGEDNANQTFGMTVQAVPEEVCKKILALDWDNATISPDTAEGCNGGDMTFTYNNDLSPVTGSNAGGSTGGEGTDTPQEPTCEGTGNGCQKCDTTTGEWVTDETLNGHLCDAGVCTDGTCGCPNGGSLGTDGQTCCLGGYAYNGESECGSMMPAEGYCGVNIPVCGCEASYSEPSATGKGCCGKVYKYYDDGTYMYGWSFGMNNVAECNGCGYGQLVEKEGQKYCCGGGSYGEAGPYDISYCSDNGANGLTNCNSPASTGAAITQVCCEATSGMKWCASNNTCVDEQASCPCVGEGGPCQKCEDGAWVADETLNNQPCGEGGVCVNGECAVCDANHLDLCQSETECTTAQGKWCGNKTQCISKNEECCPNGGSLGTDGQTCCLSGYVYKGVEECSNLNIPGPAQEMARKGYCTLNIPVCGCDTTHTTELSSSGKGCCFGGYYDEGYWGYWSFDWNNIAECNGCGYGKLVEKEEKKYCCDGPYDISSCSYSGANDWPNCTSPASTGAAITQVCCEATSGMKWCASNNTCVDEYESCPTL